MRAGDGERVAAGQHVFAQPLRAGGVAAAVVEHLLDRRVAARERVADDDLVAVGGDVVGRVALAQRDAELFELRRHRRIHRLVAAFDVVPEFARERGDAAHEGAGDAEDVQFDGLQARPVSGLSPLP